MTALSSECSCYNVGDFDRLVVPVKINDSITVYEDKHVRTLR